MENFIKEKLLGKGCFGVVYLVRRKQDQQLYALKQVQQKNMQVAVNSFEDTEKNRALNYVRLLASLRHPNIIRFKECFYSEEEGLLNIVTEYAERGDLQKKIKSCQRQQNLRIGEDELWKILSDIAKGNNRSEVGLYHLHKNNILHRDIKPANILESATGYKIADLNTAKVVVTRDPLAHTQIGTPYYACPETWKEEEYSEKCDIWSLGVVMYELAALRLPFPAQTKEELNKRILEMTPPPLNSTYYSAFFRKLVESMLSKNELDRPSTRQILEHCKMHQRVKRETEEDCRLAGLLDTILFEEEDLDWVRSLPPSKFSPAKNESRSFRRLSQIYNMQPSFVPGPYRKKKKTENSPSLERENKMSALPPKCKPIGEKLQPVPYVATPTITRKNSSHLTRGRVDSCRENSRYYNNISLVSPKERLSRPISRLPNIHSDRNNSRKNLMR